MFKFNLNLKLGATGGVPSSIREFFPSVDSVTMFSKDFETMGDAAMLCAESLNDIVMAINHACGSDKFKLLNEINPELSGLPTISKNWEPNELTKMWIVEAKVNPNDGKRIAAFGIGQVFSDLPISELKL